MKATILFRLHLFIGDELIKINSSGLAWISQYQILRDDIEIIGVSDDQGLFDIPVHTTHCGEIIGLPEPRENTIYIVSSEVRNAVQRDDCFSADIGPTAVRNAQGQIIGVRGLVK